MTPTIRVFISSTFRDMHAERDALNRIVFPELRSRCLRRGAEFIGVDLRWGVTEEEGQAKGALAVCLDEIERCRPFFVCLLGDRFGWVPPPEEIAAIVFEAARDEGSLTAETREWYRLDATVDPPVYRLRHDVAAPTDSVADRLTAFWESRGVPGAGDSITAREILRGVFEDGYPSTHALFYLRRSGIDRAPGFPQALTPAFVESDPRRRARLDALKRRIEEAHLFKVVHYDAAYRGVAIDPALLPDDLSDDDRRVIAAGVIAPNEWPRLSSALQRAIGRHGTVALSDMDELAAEMIDDLWRAIEPTLDAAPPDVDRHADERRAHEQFLRRQTRAFHGRVTERDRVLRYVAAPDDNALFVVTGAPGAGKSAFMAECARVCREADPGALVLPFFIGAVAGSSALPAALRSLCEALRRVGAGDEEVATDPQQLRVQLARLLSHAVSRRRVVILIDALNQLDPAGRGRVLDWLPRRLPPGAHIVVSTLAGECLDQLVRTTPADHVLTLQALTTDDQMVLAERFLRERRKALSASQFTALLDTARRPDVGLPLYLLVALEELCLFGDYQALADRIARLPPTLPELFAQVLARLEHDHTRRTVQAVCGWLCVARSGLLESEVLDLLGRGNTFPRVTWTRLYRALEPYLKPRDEDERTGARLDFYHDQLRIAAFRRYLGTDPAGAPTREFLAAHRRLAARFRVQARDGSPSRGWRADRPRALSELPYHVVEGAWWMRASGALCDLGFVEAKCAAGMTYELVTDCRHALERWPEARADAERVRAYAQFVAAESGRLALYAAHPSFTLQQAINFARTGPVSEDAAARRPSAWPMFVRPSELRPLWQSHPALLRTMGLGVVCDSACLAMTPDGTRAVARGRSAALTVWDVETGECLAGLGESGGLSGPVGISPDGRYATSTAGSTASMWDLAAGQRLASTVLSSAPTAIAMTAAADRMLVGGSGGEVEWHDLVAGLRLSSVRGHEDSVVGLAISSDNQRAVTSSWDGTVGLWDLNPLRLLQRLEGHDGRVRSVAFTPDGAKAVSVGDDGTLRIWNLHTFELPQILDAHARDIYGVAVSGNGRYAICGGIDRKLRVWDLASGVCVKTFSGHGDWVSDVAVTADGRRAISSSEDGTLRVWDVAHGASEPEEQVPAPSVDSRGLKLAPAGRLSIMGSWQRGAGIWDTATARRVAEIDQPLAIERSVAFTSEGLTMFACSREAGLFEVNLTTGLVEPRFAEIANAVAVAMTPDGHRLVLGHADGKVTICDWHSGRVLRSIDSQCPGIERIDLAADGSIALVHSGAKAVAACVDLERATCTWRATPRSAWLSPDGHHVVTLMFGTGVVLHDLQSGSAATLHPLQQEHGLSALFLGSGRRLATAYDGPVIHLWDVVSGTRCGELRGHQSPAWLAASTCDGRRLISYAADRTVRLWDCESLECLAIGIADDAIAEFAANDDIVAFTILSGVFHVLRLETG